MADRGKAISRPPGQNLTPSQSERVSDYHAERGYAGGWVACTANGFRLGGCDTRAKALRIAARLHEEGK